MEAITIATAVAGSMGLAYAVQKAVLSMLLQLMQPVDSGRISDAAGGD
jgi:hypothetical protein